MKQIAFLLFFFLPATSLACSCKVTTDENAYSKSEAVFLVKITNTNLVVDNENGEVVQAKFKILEIFKNNKKYPELLQSTINWTCSTPLISGHKYLIYSNNKRIKQINACTKSRWINEAKEAILLNKYRSKNEIPNN